MAQVEARVQSTTTSATAPDAERLRRAEVAFEAGNYRAVRDELDALRASGGAEPRERAAQLVRAVSEDPAFAAVVAVCALGLFAVLAHYILG